MAAFVAVGFNLQVYISILQAAKPPAVHRLGTSPQANPMESALKGLKLLFTALLICFCIEVPYPKALAEGCLKKLA